MKLSPMVGATATVSERKLGVGWRFPGRVAGLGTADSLESVGVANHTGIAPPRGLRGRGDESTEQRTESS